MYCITKNTIVNQSSYFPGRKIMDNFEKYVHFHRTSDLTSLWFELSVH